MEKIGVGTAGFVFGGLLGFGSLLLFALGLWASREIWFEAPTGDDLQYIDLMVLLALGIAGLALPAMLGGGLIGAWWATRDWSTRSGSRFPR